MAKDYVTLHKHVRPDWPTYVTFAFPNDHKTSASFYAMLNRAFLTLGIMPCTDFSSTRSIDPTSEFSMLGRGQFSDVVGSDRTREEVLKRAANGCLFGYVHRNQRHASVSFCLPLQCNRVIMGGSAVIVDREYVGIVYRRGKPRFVFLYSSPSRNELGFTDSYSMAFSSALAPRIPPIAIELSMGMERTLMLLSNNHCAGTVEVLRESIRRILDTLSQPEMRSLCGECVSGYSPKDQLGYLVYQYCKRRAPDGQIYNPVGSTMGPAIAVPLNEFDFFQRDLGWLTELVDYYEQPQDLGTCQLWS